MQLLVVGIVGAAIALAALGFVLATRGKTGEDKGGSRQSTRPPAAGGASNGGAPSAPAQPAQAATTEEIEKTRSALRSVFKSLSGAMQTLLGSSAEYSEQLNRHRHSIGSPLSPADTTDLREVLLNELDAMRAANEAYREQLDRVQEQLKEQHTLLAEVKHEATTDFLTGVSNRRAMEQRLHEEIERSKRNGQTLSLVLLDIDRFKSINDRHGHAVGDRALRIIARAIETQRRTNDFTARFGGEEFVVILPGAKLLQAMTVAEAIRRRVEEIVFTEGQETIRFTLSAGVAEFEAQQDQMPTLIERADKALYTAKRNGRNRVEASR